MTSHKLNYSFLDQVLDQCEQVLRTLTDSHYQSKRPSPMADIQEANLSEKEKAHIAGLMRVNHTGEVCAQALYHGQGLTAELGKVADNMRQAAEEEVDHLAWCQQRLAQLDSRTSYLNPFWYVSSFLIGAAAGLAGDKISLGFVVETENQVVKHLESHLQQIPESDQRSKALLEQMRADEAHHADVAKGAGGQELPSMIKSLMALTSKVMTNTAYYL